MTAALDIDAPAPLPEPAPKKPVWPWLLTGVIVFLCVVPFILVLAISFGHKIQGAGWEWAFTLENYKRFLLLVAFI